jgi:hypothetical protein
VFKFTDGAAAPASFDGTTFSKPNTGAEISFDEETEVVNSGDEITFFAKLNKGLAVDPFVNAGLSEPKVVVADGTATVAGL